MNWDNLFISSQKCNNRHSTQCDEPIIVTGKFLQDLNMKFIILTNNDETMNDNKTLFKIDMNEVNEDIRIFPFKYYIKMINRITFDDVYTGFRFVYFVKNEYYKICDTGYITEGYKTLYGKKFILGKNKTLFAKFGVKQWFNHIKENIYWYELAPDHIKNNKTICIWLFYDNPSDSLNMMPDKIKNNIKFCKVIVIHDAMKYKKLPIGIKENKDFCKFYINFIKSKNFKPFFQWQHYYECIPISIRNDAEISQLIGDI
jgi:hypothetical protein